MKREKTRKSHKKTQEQPKRKGKEEGKKQYLLRLKESPAMMYEWLVEVSLHR